MSKINCYRTYSSFYSTREQWISQQSQKKSQNVWSPIHLLFASQHQWRHSEPSNPGSNTVTLGTKTCKLTRTLKNMTLHSLNDLLWTIKVLITGCANKVSVVCNLWEISKSQEVQKGFWCFDEQADSSAPSPWTSTEPYSKQAGTYFCQSTDGKWGGYLCSALCISYRNTLLCLDWTN